MIALAACYALVRLGRDAASTSLAIPFFKDMVFNFGWFFVIFGAFVMVGAGNAVNLTDGLDGLAIVPVMIAAASFGMIAYLTGNAVFSDYLQIKYVAGTGELAVLCGAVLGAGLGFLWFNAPPASIFMGDTGSLALGGMLGATAVAVKHEIVLAVIGGLFVLEADLRDRAGGVVQADRQARVPDGAAASSFRAEGLDRAADRDPVLDHLGDAGAGRPLHAEAAVIALIPVTSFAGKTVAVFGLGGSGLASCHALKAGGAEVIAGDDSADNVAKAAQAGFITADLRTVSWANFAALILTPGAPLTHPAPHWSVLMARQAGVEVIGDIELFCRERRRHAPDAPFVAITGTNGKSTTTALIAHLMKVAGYDTQMGGNIGTAILSLEPPRMGRVHVVEMSSYQIDLAPSLDPSVGILLNVSEDHIDRHGTLEHYAAVKARLVAGVQPQGTVDRRRRRRLVPQHRRPPRPGRQARGAHLREEPAARRHLCRARNHRAGLRRRAQRNRKARRHRFAARPAQCAERGLRRRPARWRWASRPMSLQNGLRSFPGLAHRMEQVGRRGNVLFVNDSKGTNADAAAHALSSFGDIFWIAGGKPKLGGITGLTEYFPRIRKAYLIGEAAQEFAGTLGERVPHEISRNARCRRRQRRARRGSLRARRSRGAAVARLRLVRPVPQFRNPRRASSAIW